MTATGQPSGLTSLKAGRTAAQPTGGPGANAPGPAGACEWCGLPADHYPDACPALLDPEPRGRALWLYELMVALAGIRHQETAAYAAAFLAAQGTEQARTQTAKLATVDLHFDAERAAARVAAYQLLARGDQP